MKRTRGFTLLEMLVATTVMAIAVVGLLSALSTSMRNAGRLTNHDRAALVARRRMEELLLARLPKMQVLEGPLTPATDAGLEGMWRARLTPFEVNPMAQAGLPIVERLELEIAWKEGDVQKTFRVDGYKSELLRPEDMPK